MKLRRPPAIAAQLREEHFRRDLQAVVPVYADVSQDVRALEYADVELKEDKEVAIAAVRQNGLALEYADAELNTDKEVVIASVRQRGSALN